VTEEEHVQEVEVVVWHPDLDSNAVLDGISTLTVRTDDERALASVAREVETRTGLTTAILELTDTHLHLELLGPVDVVSQWRVPRTPIVGDARWNRRGWLTETRCKIEEALERAAGASRVGPFRQVKHWSISALIEVESDAGTFWFKQVPPFMAHEAPLTSWLSAVRPGAVPEVVAHGDDWFLSAAFDPPSEGRSLESPHGLLAELQLSAADQVDELVALGCPDRTLPDFIGELRALAERSDVLERALAERLIGALPHIGELVEQLLASPVPSSLVHGDLHSGNWTRRSDGSWLIFDWTDGCVAHPFVDLGVLPHRDVEVRDARLAAYLAPWRDAFGDELVSATVDAALPAAFGFHALSYQRIADGVGGADAESWKPAVASFVTRLVEALP
jgi:hypothetical protein